MVLPRNSWRDEPTNKDWIEFDELWGGDMKPEVRVGKELPIQDQSKQIQTSDACGQYMMTHSVNAMNLFRWWDFLFKWEEQRENFIDMYQHTPRYKNVDIRTEGSRLQDNLEFARRTGMIAWYYKVSWVDSIRKALSLGRTIAAWSKKINWRETRQDPYVAVGNSWAWHFFGITIYRDFVNMLSCPNSYWEESYDNWYHHINYNDTSLLYTRYALIPKEEKHISSKVKMNVALARIVMNQSDGNPSELDRLTYWKYIKYRERRGDYRF